MTSAEPFTEYIRRQGFTQEISETVDNETTSERNCQINSEDSKSIDSTGLTGSSHPLQQITVNWGTADNELSAGENNSPIGFTRICIWKLLIVNLIAYLEFELISCCNSRINTM